MTAIQLQEADYLKVDDTIIQGDLKKVTHNLAVFYNISEISVVRTKGTLLVSISCSGVPSGCVSILESKLTPVAVDSIIDWFTRHNVKVVNYEG